jgi:hypothetical protein
MVALTYLCTYAICLSPTIPGGREGNWGQTSPLLDNLVIKKDILLCMLIPKIYTVPKSSELQLAMVVR